MLVFLTVREPVQVKAEVQSSFSDTLRLLASRRTFRHIAAGGTVASFTLYGINQFLFAYFSRAFGLSPSHAAIYIVTSSGIASVLGGVLGGLLADRLSRRRPAVLAFLPGAGLILGAPLFALGFQATTPALFVACLAPGALLLSAYGGLITAITLNIVPSQMRPTAAAVLLFIIALGGVSLGPPAMGLLSDFLASRALPVLKGAGIAQLCGDHVRWATGCELARLRGLRSALTLFTGGLVWAGAHFLAASRSLGRETVVE
jgi:MFS family permease